MSRSGDGSKKTTHEVPVFHETSPLLNASSSGSQYGGGSFTFGRTPDSGSSSQNNGVTHRIPADDYHPHRPSVDSLSRSVPNIGSVRNIPSADESHEFEIRGWASAARDGDDGRDVENGTDDLSDGSPVSAVPFASRVKGALSGKMSFKKTGSRVSDPDTWRFKYHHLMADMPALDNSTFGAGHIRNLSSSCQYRFSCISPCLTGPFPLTHTRDHFIIEKNCFECGIEHTQCCKLPRN